MDATTMPKPDVTKIIHGYKFATLPEETQQEIIERFAKFELPDSEQQRWVVQEMVESLKGFCEAFGLRLKNYSIGTCQSFISVEIKGDYWGDQDAIENLAGVRLWKWLHNNLDHVFYQKKTRYLHKPSGYKVKTFKGLITETDCPFTGVCFDESLLKPFRDFLKGKNTWDAIFTHTDFQDLIHMACEEAIKEWEEDLQWYEGEEYAKDCLLHGYACDRYYDITGNRLQDLED